jgi:hypothetical protein
MTMPTTNISTTPCWATSATLPPFAKLAEDVETDVVIVGAGVTGLTAAYVAGIPVDRIVNCWPVDRLLAWLSNPTSSVERDVHDGDQPQSGCSTPRARSKRPDGLGPQAAVSLRAMDD